MNECWVVSGMTESGDNWGMVFDHNPTEEEILDHIGRDAWLNSELEAETLQSWSVSEMDIISVLFVGMRPGNPGRGKSTSIKRLEKWTEAVGLNSFSFINCCHETMGVDPDGEFLSEACSHHEKIVALGNFASDCLEKLHINHHKMPHPSGRNRHLNDPEYERLAVESLERYLEEATAHGTQS